MSVTLRELNKLVSEWIDKKSEIYVKIEEDRLHLPEKKIYEDSTRTRC